MNSKKFLFVLLFFCLAVFYLGAQPASSGNQALELQLKRIAILSSGVGYFEHSGNVASPAELSFTFDIEAVNDALKSLVINDPSSKSLSIRYAAQNTLERTLRSLKIDLSGSKRIADILESLKGAELEVFAPNSIKGRIIGVEYRPGFSPVQFPNTRYAEEAWLSLFTAQGIKQLALKDIASFVFVDEAINADLERALDLIMASRDENVRNLIVSLDGRGSRSVSVSYVIPSPIWKVSYRLDLSAKEPFIQGWAIVDNDSDTDWKNVELSLVTGRPVSFIQNLYPPYKLSRPVVPLAIAGFAQSQTYESGYGDYDQLSLAGKYFSNDMIAAESSSDVRMRAPSASVTGGSVQTTSVSATGSTAGEQFEFTLKNPITLLRRQSSMFPLVEGSVKAEKILVFSGSRAQGGATINPAIGVELTNNTGMKLPAGPITVYDAGTYAGDALIEFFPENEKRLISYGEDLSVTGNVTSSPSRYITAVSISSGVMTISRRQSYEWAYSIRNASGESKKLIIEHPVTAGAELVEPKTADDRTSALYRFNQNLPSRGNLSFKVKEEIPISERITLANLRPDAFLSYATNQEIPANVRAVLNRAIELKRIADEAAAAQSQLESQMSRLVSEQDRVRRNLEAAGNQSPQGQDYLKRLASLDGDIDSLNKRIDAATSESIRSKREYDAYIATIQI